MLLGPGVAYLVGARFLRLRQSWAARLALRVASAHLAAIVIAMIVLSLNILGPWAKAAFVPASINLFFIPALIAFIVHTYQAKRAAELLDPTQRAFEMIPLATQAPPPDQP
jgi:hypothetical protein